MALFASAFLLVLAQAVNLQVLRRDFLLEQGDARALRDVAVAAHRGMITDREGEPMAVSTPVASIWMNPRDFSATAGQLQALATLLETTPARLRELQRERPGREFVYLQRQVDPQLARQVMDLNISGVALQREYHRYYPAGEVAAHIIGFTDIDDHGQEGLELAYDEWLRAYPGRERVVKSGGRQWQVVETVAQLQAPREGKDLVLSIDRRLQYLTYRELKAAVQRNHARSGSAVVLDTRSGEVLALVNQPSYNPNNRGQYGADTYRNRVVTDLFEPGSTVKPFIVAAAIASGAYRPDTAINTSPGTMRVGSATIHDMHDYGLIDVRTVLQKSSNIGASKIALSLEPKYLWQNLSDFGFGEAIGSGFPGESLGILKPYRQWGEVERATLAYGYGLSTSALHLAQAYAALLGDGKMRPVSYMKLSPQQIADLPAQKVLEMATVRQMRDMLMGVVSDEGTASQAEVKGYKVAGKTGTVRKAGGGGYLEDSYNALFAGAIPASDPRLVMVVTINDPRGEKYYGGAVSAPVFAKVMAGAMRLLNIPPDQFPGEPTKIAMAGGQQ